MGRSHRLSGLLPGGRARRRHRDSAHVGRTFARPLPRRAGEQGRGNPAEAAIGSEPLPLNRPLHEHPGADRRVDLDHTPDRCPVHELERAERVATLARIAGVVRAFGGAADCGRGHAEDAGDPVRGAGCAGDGGSGRPARHVSQPDPVGGHDHLTSPDRRTPVYEEDLDHIVGLVHAKDLLLYYTLSSAQKFDIDKVLRPIKFTPEQMKVDELLLEMRTEKVHMMIVVDEYGGTAGLVTMEDLLEEIVGEIRDEY